MSSLAVAGRQNLRCVTHEADLCVVGGGLSGLCAALAAARRGCRVVLMHDRPVFGGNASSEIRMWVWGARGKNNRETGIIEEILLENMFYNPMRNYSIWDSILYGKARTQKNLTMLLNCSCNDMEMQGRRIRSVTGWQTTTQTWHTVRAALFADCSGDSILAPMSGAEVRVGREARSEFNESLAVAKADRHTMGMSCLIQTRETPGPQGFLSPPWARAITSDDQLFARNHIPCRPGDEAEPPWEWNNFWWIELGGDRDSIHDTETIRDELLSAAFGVWDHIKNHGDHGASRWALDWVGFLPGKRESRRYVGDYIVTENDVRAGGPFEDVVAYAGWPLDDHHPGGLNHPGEPSKIYPLKTIWGIPYRALYSRNTENLFCAGRNISVSHVALSSCRVMATCSLLGQAVGTAAALAIQDGLTPRQVYERKMGALQKALMEDDCYLPGLVRPMPETTQIARLTSSRGDPAPLRNGVDRPVGDNDNAWTGRRGDWIEYAFESPRQLHQARLVFDSDLNRRFPTMLCRYPIDLKPLGPPASLVRAFRVQSRRPDGTWVDVVKQANNHQRLVVLPLDLEASAVRLVLDDTWGADCARVFAWDLR